MFRYVLLILVFLTFSLLSNSAHARYDVSKVGDWKYRSYICKNVVSNVMRMHELVETTKNEMNNANQTFTEEELLSSAEQEASKQIQQHVINDEKTYRFDEHDAQTIALLTTSIYSGLMAGRLTDDPIRFVSLAFENCIGVMDVTDKNLVESVK